MLVNDALIQPTPFKGHMKEQKTKLYSASALPGITQHLYDKVLAAFKPRPIKDNDTLIAIGRQAGRQEVIDFLYKYITEGYISGDQKDIDIKTQEYSPTQRLLKGIQPNRE